MYSFCVRYTSFNTTSQMNVGWKNTTLSYRIISTREEFSPRFSPIANYFQANYKGVATQGRRTTNVSEGGTIDYNYYQVKVALGYLRALKSTG